MKNDNDEVNWNAVIARCLAYLCLKNSKCADKSVLEQSAFLEQLGLPLADRAGVVGSTVASIRELARLKGVKKHEKKSRRS